MQAETYATSVYSGVATVASDRLWQTVATVAKSPRIHLPQYWLRVTPLQGDPYQWGSKWMGAGMDWGKTGKGRGRGQIDRERR